MTSDAASDSRLAGIADRLAISDVIYRYCRAMDRIDHELGYSVWHEDGTADYGDFFKGTGRAFVDWTLAQHGHLLAHSHQVSNILIELDADRAGSESYVTAALRLEREGKLIELTARGRYVDRWSRRAGRWGIDERVYLHDFDDMREVAAPRVPGWGTRDRGDYSYRVLTRGR
jgi:hypothetical protein